MTRLNIYLDFFFSVFRVKGITKLRIVDSSVMPSHVSGDLYAPIIMMAEKAADIIKSTYRKIYKRNRVR